MVPYSQRTNIRFKVYLDEYFPQRFMIYTGAIFQKENIIRNITTSKEQLKHNIARIRRHIH